MAMYVVSGATGRVGSAVAGELLNNGLNVRVIVRNRERGRRWAARGVEVMVGSFEDAAFLTSTLREADGFFTLLPENPAAEDFHGYRRNLADAIGRAVRASGIPRVVMLSAVPAALGEGNGPPKDLHYMEHALRDTGAVVTAMRACYFQDNVALAVGPASEAGIVANFLPSADDAFPMIAARDVGRFSAEALATRPTRSETVDLFGPAYSIRQVADRLAGALGRPVRVVDIPPIAHVKVLTDAGIPRPYAEAIAEMYAAMAAGRVRPGGERSLMGTTRLEETIASILAPAAGNSGRP